MKNYSFVEVHLKAPNHIWCEICDHGPGEDVSKYYEYEVIHTFPDGAYPITHKALGCCIHHGDVVDWREE